MQKMVDELANNCSVCGAQATNAKTQLSRSKRKKRSSLAATLRYSAVLILATTINISAMAGPKEQARRIHDRLIGVPPSGAVLEDMASSIDAGDALGAAYQAMENAAFYNSTLKNFVTPWTNEAQTVFADFNDYAATAIGIVRDERPFTDVLTADLVYMGADNVVSRPYSHTDNEHYELLERERINLADPSQFIGVRQSSLPGSQLQSSETAGVITTRAAGEAFFRAGTNRRMLRFLAVNYLCRDMEELKDTTRATDRIRQDVSRSPGGDSSQFLNSCSGCHSGMDPMAQAFAYFNFDEDLGRVVHTRGRVQPKYLINANTFPFGFVTPDNRWDNFWRGGPHSALGWRGNAASGFGAKSLGEEVANSRAFSECQVEKVFESVCLTPPRSADHGAEISRITRVFEANNYSLKRVFAETATYCMGE